MSPTAGSIDRILDYQAMVDWFRNRNNDDSCVISPSWMKDNKVLPLGQFHGMIGFYSSGSSGKPTLIWKSVHSIESACTASHRTQGWTWATCFNPWSFAGVHVACQAAISKGHVLELDQNWQSNLTLLQERKPEALSTTPTFLDLLIQSCNDDAFAHNWKPKQITLGGEILRPTTGKRIANAFPGTRITLIYASAELGLIAKTQRTDGWFPIQSLKQNFSQWNIQNDELLLYVKDRWIKTGDLCEMKADAFRVLGRVDRIMNIGGEKVYLDEVETIAESLPYIRRASAQAKANPIVGQVVALTLESSEPSPNQALLDSTAQSLRKQLPKPAWPRWLSWGEIHMLKNGKRIGNDQTHS